jgi:short-subunit dehydrogenase
MASSKEGSGRTTLVTGASAGIGRAFALEFARHGFDLVLTARREQRLVELAAEIGERFGVGTEVIAADLSDPSAPAKLVAELNERSIQVDGLVNNAGFGIAEPFHRTSWEQQRVFLQVLVTSGVELVHRLLPSMIERKYGRIINVASLAGLIPGASGYTLYAGAKSFMIKFAEALYLENYGTGVHVSAVCPGFTFSEFHDVAGVRVDVSRMPSFMWMDAETVARQGYKAVMKNKPLYANGRVNRFLAAAAKFTPLWLTRRVGRRARHYGREGV